MVNGGLADGLSVAIDRKSKVFSRIVTKYLTDGRKFQKIQTFERQIIDKVSSSSKKSQGGFYIDGVKKAEISYRLDSLCQNNDEFLSF